MLKVYDLKITNVDLLPNSSNHKAMLPYNSKNIPQKSVSKIFQGYPQNIVMPWKFFYEVKNLKYCLVDYPMKLVIIAILLS